MASVIPQILGHRGCAATELENSHAAFARAAGIAGIAGVELDVQLGADGSILVFHDRDLQRLAGDQRPVAGLRDADRRQIELCVTRPNGTGFVASGIPSLDEVRELLPRDQLIDIELKSYRDSNPGLPRAIAEWIQHHGGPQNNRLMVSSFDPFLLRRFRREVRRLGISVPTAAIYSEHPEVPWLLRRGLGTRITGSEYAKPDWRSVQRMVAERGSPAGRQTLPAPRPLWVWTVNERAVLREMTAAGVDAVIGDDPEQLVAWLREDAAPDA